MGGYNRKDPIHESLKLCTNLEESCSTCVHCLFLEKFDRKFYFVSTNSFNVVYTNTKIQPIINQLIFDPNAFLNNRCLK